MLLEAAAVAPGGGAWFVGQTGDGGPEAPVIFHWDGTRVRLMPLPRTTPATAELRAVAAPADDDAWAVGLDLVLHWNGRSWRRSYFPGGSWWGISADAPDDVWLVGLTDDLSEAVYRWNGTRWRRMPFLPFVSTSKSRQGNRVTILNGQLDAVLALAPDDVWVAGAGADQQEFVAHWDGTRWTVTPADPNATFTSFAALSSGDVWAAGELSVIEWLRGAWHVRSRWPHQVSSVVARRGELWGSRGGMLLRWTGARWLPLEQPHPDAPIEALAAAPDGSVWAATDPRPVHYVCGAP